VEIDLTAADPEVGEALRYLATGADHRFAELATMHYAVVPTGSTGSTAGSTGSTAGPSAVGWRVDEEGDRLEIVADPEGVLDLVYRRVHQRAFELASLRGWVRLHAAVVDLDRGPAAPPARVLLVAPSGTGKTTLSCRLLLDGQATVADESTLVRDGVALPVARRFHLKPGLEAVVPDLARHTGSLPGLADATVRAFDPTEAGFAWSIAEARVDHVVLVERAVGGSALVPASAVEAMPALVDKSFPHQEPTGHLLGQVAALLREARCWHLALDSLDEASILVRELANE